jgi:hypothetical protein
MQRAIGYILGVIIVRVVLPAILGPIGMMYFALGVCGIVLIALADYGWHLYRIRRLHRRSCDNAIHYARKKRRAFDEPDYSESDLSDIRIARRRGDFRKVYAIISASDLRLREKKHAEDSRLNAKRMADEAAARRRPSEIGLYRA